MAHHCKSLIIHCIDFRLQKSIKEHMEKAGLLGDCDAVSVAGAVKNTNFILEQIGISARLHNIQEVVLVNHTDCGAYGGSLSFNSDEVEKDFHINELQKAREIISAKYPDLAIKLMLAKITEGGQIDFETIA